MMRSQWRNDIRLELMREAAREQGICQRCGGAFDYRDDPDQVVCSDCQYDDWHEEYPEVFPEQEDGDAS